MMARNKNSGFIFTDNDYHKKQKNPIRSVREEIREIYKSNLPKIEKKSTDMINKLSDGLPELYYQLREHKKKYTENFKNFCNNITVDKNAVDRDPLMSKFQKTFEQQMVSAAIEKNGNGFFKNTTASSYGGYGGTAHFMIRALSYIYPMLIIQPLPKLTWREDWDVLEAEGWAQFGVFLTAQRIYNATDVNEEANDSGRVEATFGESIFQNITVRQDIVWDSTPEFYADQSMNNGLVSWVYFEALKRGFDEKINDIYLFGDTNFGLTGLVTNPNITQIQPSGTWGSTNGSNEQYSTLDLINLTQTVEQNSNGVYTTKKIMMSLKLKPYVVIPRSAYVSTSPIGYVAGQKWGVDFAAVLENVRYNPYLNNEGTTTNTQVAFAYDTRMDFAHIGVPFFMFAEPVSWEGHKYKLPFLTRTGGWRLIQSPSVVMMNNIAITGTLP